MNRVHFWFRQLVRIAILVAIGVGVALYWKSRGHAASAAFGWLAAGIAVAAGRVVTSFAGYLILLRGNVFTVGDRITIGGVRGDVVSLGFMQTTVMEMGQTPAEQSDDPSMWIGGRQYSGRIVRITNDKIFDSPVYNYTHGFPFMWDEIKLPVRYGDDHARVERMLLDATTRHTRDVVASAREKLPDIEQKYFRGEKPDLDPRVYLRLTDNWIELAVRYLAPSRGSRAISDAINRDVLREMTAANIPVASTTQTVTVVH